MKDVIKNLLVPTALLLAGMTQPATAAFLYQNLNPANGSNAANGNLPDVLGSLSSTYDPVGERFTWNTEFTSSAVDGAWLVVNNGPNPKASSKNELAIVFMDRAGGWASVFGYNGQNNRNSFTSEDWLGRYALNWTGTSLALDLDVSGINAPNLLGPDWVGVQFDSKIGIWFHMTTGSQFSYDTNGRLNVVSSASEAGALTGYSFAQQGWYDRANLNTTAVPAPMTLVLLASGLVGMASTARRRAT